MGTLLALLLPAIPGLINTAEVLFAGKKKSGTDKLNAVLQQAQVLLTQLGVAGLIPPNTTVSADGIIGMIETKLAQMKADGTLGKTAPETGSLYLIQGAVTPLTAIKTTA